METPVDGSGASVRWIIFLRRIFNDILMISVSNFTSRNGTVSMWQRHGGHRAVCGRNYFVIISRGIDRNRDVMSWLGLCTCGDRLSISDLLLARNRYFRCYFFFFIIIIRTPFKLIYGGGLLTFFTAMLTFQEIALSRRDNRTNQYMIHLLNGQ